MVVQDYGYGLAVPDSEQYGYDDGSPDLEDSEYEAALSSAPSRQGDPQSKLRRGSSQRSGRRSSMKDEGASRRSSISYTGEITVNLPGQSRPIRRRTSISFGGEDEVLEVQPVRELAEKPEELWFQKEEYGVIRDKAILLTKLAAAGADKLITEKKLCIRGLESHINQDSVEEEQMLAWKSVFLEQYCQREEGGFDDEAVAEMYEMASRPSRARALRQAQGDMHAAEKHTRGVRSVLKRHSLMG